LGLLNNEVAKARSQSGLERQRSARFGEQHGHAPFSVKRSPAQLWRFVYLACFVVAQAFGFLLFNIFPRSLFVPLVAFGKTSVFSVPRW
jgi:hypothetical protein